MARFADSVEVQLNVQPPLLFCENARKAVLA
jgi:hypothetical protein